nr:hypothetical protein [Tanacetum cinerariifolium]
MITVLEISSSSPGEEDYVVGMQIPKELITDNIWNAPYYNATWKWVQSMIRKLHLKREERRNDEPQPAPKPQVEDEEYDLQRGIQMSLESFRHLAKHPSVEWLFVNLPQ